MGCGKVRTCGLADQPTGKLHVNKKLSTEFANEFSALVSHTAAMMAAAAVLALDQVIFLSVLWLFFPRPFLTGGRTAALHSLLVPYGR